QEIALQYAIADDLAGLGAHAFFVEGRGADAADDVRVFDHIDVRRENRLAQRIEQEGRLAVQGAARSGLDESTDQAGRQRRFEQHRAGA
nr:hypothetical protein [Tanacetum cinerariifolium]